MKRFARVSLACLAAALIGAAAFAQTSSMVQAGKPAAKPGTKPAAGPGGGAPLVFRNFVLFDQQGLGVEVFRMLIPKDWKFAGGLTWNFAKNPPDPVIEYAISSPDGNSVIQSFRNVSLYWSPDQNLQYNFAQMGNTILQPVGAVDFLKNVFIPQVRGGVSDLKIVEAQPLPAVAEQALNVLVLMLNISAQITPPPGPYEPRADAARVKIEYTYGGRRWVEDFVSTITYYITSSSSLYASNVPSINWTASASSVRCPAEEVPSRIRQFLIAAKSHYDNPVWLVGYTRLSALITREQLQQQQAIFARYRQIHQTLEECSDIVWQTFQRKNAADDRMFESYSQALRGVDTYIDPISNRSFEVPVEYDHAWTNGTDYIFSNDASFDPASIANGNWQPLTRKR